MGGRGDVIRPSVSLYFSTDHCAPEKKPMTQKSSKDVPKIRSPKTRTSPRISYCRMVVKEILSRLLEEEEKLEWWFKQDIDKEEVRFEGDEDGDEV
ncbi:hypothetical protein Tco_1505792 [Tanacetum coccineum]